MPTEPEFRATDTIERDIQRWPATATEEQVDKARATRGCGSDDGHRPSERIDMHLTTALLTVWFTYMAIAPTMPTHHYVQPPTAAIEHRDGDRP